MNITPINSIYENRISSNSIYPKTAYFSKMNDFEYDSVSFSGTSKLASNKLKTYVASVGLSIASLFSFATKGVAQEAVDTVNKNKPMSIFEQLIETGDMFNVKVFSENTVSNKCDKNANSYFAYIANFIERDNNTYSLTVKNTVDGPKLFLINNSVAEEKGIPVASYNMDFYGITLENGSKEKLDTYKNVLVHVLCQFFDIKLPVVSKQFPNDAARVGDIRYEQFGVCQYVHQDDVSWVVLLKEILEAFPDVINMSKSGYKTREQVYRKLIEAQAKYAPGAPHYD